MRRSGKEVLDIIQRKSTSTNDNTVTIEAKVSAYNVEYYCRANCEN